MSTGLQKPRSDLESVLDLLAEAGGKMHRDDEDIKFEGRTYVLPERLTLRESGEHLIELADAEEEMQAFRRQYNYRPWDGAVATVRALKFAFGSYKQVTNNPFSPAQNIDVKIGVDETISVMWGEFTVPGLDRVQFSTGNAKNQYGPVFNLTAFGPKKYRQEINGLFNLVENELKERSIYRGKVFDGQEMPEFVDLSGVDPEKIVYSEDVMTQLETNLWLAIRQPQKMRDLGIPLKYCVVLEGPFGTGKTLATMRTAQIAQENNWTCIHVRPGRDNVEEALQTATLYAPCVVLIEDVETFSSGDTDKDAMSKILDLFDGIDSKTKEIILVGTTNHKEQIHPGMLRPGRIDNLIHIGQLDLAGIMRMAKSLIEPKLLSEDIDWERVGLAMDGFLPAFAKEAINRAIRYSITRNGDIDVLTTEDLVNAAVGLRPQFELMSEAVIEKKDPTIDTALLDVVRRAMFPVVAAESQVTNELVAAGIQQAAENVVERVGYGVRETVGDAKLVDYDGDIVYSVDLG